MLKKDRFIEIMEMLARQNVDSDNIYNYLKESSFGGIVDSNLFNPYCFVSLNLDIIIELLSISVNDNADLISYWIFECDWGKKNICIIIDDSKEIIIKTLEDLYDIIQSLNVKYLDSDIFISGK